MGGEFPATTMYAWLCERLAGRSQSARLPAGAPETFENLSVRAYRNGKAGFILFEPLDSLAGALTEMPVKVKIKWSTGVWSLKFQRGTRPVRPGKLAP
jgi:hypothetical protein